MIVSRSSPFACWCACVAFHPCDRFDRRELRGCCTVQRTNGRDGEGERVAVRELESDAERRALVCSADRSQTLPALTPFALSSRRDLCDDLGIRQGAVSHDISLLLEQHRDVRLHEAERCDDIDCAHPRGSEASGQ